ncbi:MAG: hypothetical protein AB8B91_23225 [Rubripirellula sp.]
MSMSLAKQARVLERDLLGMLLGATAGVVLVRLALLVTDVNLYVFAPIILVAAWTGGFVAHLATNRTSEAMDSLRSLSIAFRSIGLRLMLWLLGGAAVLGVLAVLTESFDVVGRVAGTAALTGVAAGLLFVFLSMLDVATKRRSGLLGASSVLTSYLLIAPVIWEVGNRSEEVVFSAFVLLLMLPVGLVAMSLMERAQTRFAGWLALVLYGCSLVLLLFAVWNDGIFDSMVFSETGFALLGFGSLAVASLVNAFTADGRFWRWIGVAAATLAAGIVINCVWTDMKIDENWIVAITSIAVVAVHANLILLIPLKSSQHWWRIATIVMVAITAITLDIEMFVRPSSSNLLSLFGRIALASGILASTGTLAMVILHRLNRSSRVTQREAGAGELSEVSLTCPGCGQQRIVTVGASTPCQCGVRVVVTVEVGH